jgi:WD40 repeat protein/DNA-binding SARP family transcriptional activator
VGITVLGPIGIDGIARELGRRDRVVLGVLAMRPGQASTLDRLVDALWGQTPPKSADKVAQGCVWRLRKVLGHEAIATSGLGYTLVVPPDDVDAHRFARMVGRGRELLAVGEFDRAAFVLGEAAALWRGRPYAELEGWPVADIESGRLETMRLDAEELAVEAALTLGGHRDVASVAFAMVQAAPMRERRWALLAHAQYQAGRQEEALGTIREVKILLSENLGLDPSPDLVALEQAILRQEDSLAASDTATSGSDTCPYQGLPPYDVDDAESFFGREADLDACLKLLGSHGTLTIVGPSGSGKSSLVRAGVAAVLRRQERPVTIVTPGAHPAAQLEPASGRPRRPTLVVDQLEEVFTLCDDEAEREQFFAALVAHADEGVVVLALRADRLGDLAAYPSVARLAEQGLYLLGAMSEDGLCAAILSPARQVGLVVEPGLVDLLLRDVEDEPGALPLLSHALRETWKRCEGNTLTVDGYRDSGAIRGAVAQSAEQVYAGIEPGQRHLMRQLLLRLVTYGGPEEPVRSRVPRRLLGQDPETDALVDALVSARLVSSDAGVLEVSHEALARAWPRLRAWLEDDIEGERIRHHLTAAADAWDSMGRPDSELYRGVRLGRAAEWRAGRTAIITQTEAAFLDASREMAATQERSAAERVRVQSRLIRRLRTVLVVAAVLLLAAATAGVVAKRQADRAGSSARTADARRVGARALITADISASALLAVAGARLDDSPATRANLMAVLAQHPSLVRSTPYDGDPITGLEVSPDGQTLAVYDLVGRVQLYDTTDLDPVGDIAPEPADPPFQWFAPMAYSPDGSTLAVGAPALSADPLLLLDATTLERLPAQLGGLNDRRSRVEDVTFSADGSTVAAVIQRLRRAGKYWAPVGHDVMAWDLRDPRHPVRVLRMPLGRDPNAHYRGMVALSPDGQTLYTSIKLAAYDVATGRKLYSHPFTFPSTGVPGHTSDYFELSPDGTLIAVTRVPQGLLLVDSGTGEVRRRLRGHEDQVTGVRFSHDGTLVASVSPDRTATVWDVHTGEIRERLQLGEADAQGIAFSTDDSTLYTGGAGMTIREWDLSGSRRFVAQLLPPGELRLGGVGPAPGGRYAATTGTLFTRFLDVQDLTWTRNIEQDEGFSGGVAWNGAGDEFVTTGIDYVKIWDPSTGQVARKTAVRGNILSAAFARDDTLLVVVDEDGVVTSLDAESLEPAREPVDWGRTGGKFSIGPDGNEAFHLTGSYLPDQLYEHSASGWELVDLRTGTVVNKGDVGFDTAWMASSPDGRHAAVGGTGGQVVVLDLDTGQPVRPATVGHSSSVWSVAYSADGSRVVTTGEDGSVSLWDGATGELLGSVLLPERVSSGADFGADAATVLIGTEYQSVYVWDTGLTRALDFACKIAGRDFTATEWREAFGDRAYQETCPQK